LIESERRETRVAAHWVDERTPGFGEEEVSEYPGSLQVFGGA